MNQENISTGVIKRFFDGKGYGFISPDGGGDDVFFHWSQVTSGDARSLKDGQKVSFQLVEGPKGKQASDVKPVDE